MARLVCLTPHRRTAPDWGADLEPIDLERELGVAIPLLGTITAGQPIEAIEDRETLEIPSRKASYALRVRGC
ncbi:LexA family protein [Rhabdochromatium marinum]|uniref:LexA family protein n=1 Tax=Rhabdochromatium marinum TaxID=48729 RepID=UPI001F5B6E20|nr:hypothetical protein [Rhabdochromatium marinum]